MIAKNYNDRPDIITILFLFNIFKYESYLNCYFIVIFDNYFEQKNTSK